jgi:hypothetical protein
MIKNLKKNKINSLKEIYKAMYFGKVEELEKYFNINNINELNINWGFKKSFFFGYL